MILTSEILAHFSPCDKAAAEFARRWPDGLDLSRLWGEQAERNALWQELLADEFLRRYIGWAIGAGIIPARITANLREANLTGADLTEANLIRADLTGADLYKANLIGAKLTGAYWNKYTTWPAGFTPPSDN